MTKNESNAMSILILSGSAREFSHTDGLATAISSALEVNGANVTVICLARALLPHADPTYHRDPFQHPNPSVKQLVEAASSAQAIVALTPIYHNSYSAILKNALDHLAIAQFSNKPVALGSHGGSRSSQAVDHLRIVVRGLNGLTIPAQVCTDDSDYTVEGSCFVVSNPNILKRIDRQALELVNLTRALLAAK